MSDTEILIQALRIESDARREAFLVEQCRNNPEKLADLRRVLALENELRKQLASPEKVIPDDQFEEPLPSESNLTDSRLEKTASVLASDLDHASVPRLMTTLASKLTIGDGTTIAGRYVLQTKIGEGGMGEVWAAKQTAPIKRKVALKLIKRGMDSGAVLARFEQERQALAMMDHPNIAKVLDGGMTETGQPFFVMELVNGLPLTTFADQSKLTTNERLELFVPICQAVQHAHQKGIIHRDLKPANILVTQIDGRPVPKVIDFGVAKATGGSLTEHSVETQFGAVVGTLEYMSPEQAGFSGIDIDTRADIYSLGIVLYELLTGLRPIDKSRLREAGLAEMIRIIKEEDPSRPSTRLSTNESLPSLAAVRQIAPRKLTALLKGELDWVVMRCLEKSRERRYDTAIGLAGDIQRFLAGEAVEARPASTGYRLSKFIRRNRGTVIASSLILTALILGVTGTTWGWLESRKQAERARIEALTQSAISAFLRDDILAQASAATQSESLIQPDPDLKVKTALDRASIGINDRFTDQPLVAAALHRTIGRAYSDLGEFSLGQSHLERSLKIYRERKGSGDDNALQVQQDIGSVYLSLEKLDQAEKLLGEALERHRKSGGLTREGLRAAMRLAHCYGLQGRMNGDAKKRDLSKQLYIETHASQNSMFGENDLDVNLTLFSLGTLYQQESIAKDDPSLLDLAESTVQKSLDALDWLPDTHPDKLNIRYSLALIASGKRQYDRALNIQEQVLAGCIRTFGEVNPNTMRAMDSLATSYMLINKVDEAEEFHLKSLAARRHMYGDDHSMTEHALFSIGNFYNNAGHVEKAEPYYLERMLRNRRVLGPDAINTHLAGRDLALIYVSLGRAEEAEKLLAQAITCFESQFDKNNPIVLLTREYQADALTILGRLDEALAIYLNGVKQMRTQANPDPVSLASSLATLGASQMLCKKFEDAEASFRESAEVFTKYIPEAWPSFVQKANIGAALLGQKKYAEAEPILVEGIEALKARRQSVPTSLYIQLLETIIELYEATDRTDEARRYRQELEAASGSAN